MDAVLKDKTKLAVASIRGEQTQDLYVAVTKATLADEMVPKEKHVRTLKIACSAHAPRQQVDFVIYKLGKRLNNTNWVVALKALMVFHRLMRECDPSFQEQVLRFSDRTGRHRLLCLDRYADHTSKETWDYSAWIRAYGIFLDERLDVFRTMRFDPEGGAQAARQQQQGQPYGGPTGGYGGYGGPTGGYSGGYGGATGGYGGPTGGGYGSSGYSNGGPYNSPRQGGAANGGQQPPAQTSSLKECDTAELLEKLPRVQRLMLRMLSCVPEGAAAMNPLCLTAANWVLRESKAVYRAASEGVINLADKFFEMERADALRGLELYKEALLLHDKLTAYYLTMQAVPALRNAINYPTLQPLPTDFVATMEDYVKGASRDGTTAKRMPSAKLGAISSALEQASAQDEPLPEPEEEESAESEPPTPSQGASPVKAAPPPAIDLLSFDDAPSSAPAPAAAPQPKGDLDFLADGMAGQQQQAAAGGFEAGAFDNGGGAGFSGGDAAQQQQFGQQQFGYDPSGMQQPYGYGGYAPQMTGYPPQMGGYGYAPQATGYGYTPQMTGAANMALVPVGPMGMNPFIMGSSGGYGGAPAPYGMPAPATSSNNPFNPFNDGGAVGASTGGAFVGQRLENDPLNSLTEELLGAMPKPKAMEHKPAGPQPSLRELKQGNQPGYTSPTPQPVS